MRSEAEILKLILEMATENDLTLVEPSADMDKVIITCDKSNDASAATAKSCGGVLTHEFEEDGVIKQQYAIDVK